MGCKLNEKRQLQVFELGCIVIEHPCHIVCFHSVSVL